MVIRRAAIVLAAGDFHRWQFWRQDQAGFIAAHFLAADVRTPVDRDRLSTDTVGSPEIHRENRDEQDKTQLRDRSDHRRTSIVKRGSTLFPQ